MAHIRGIVDDIGDTVDLLYFCSDFCNQDFSMDEYDVASHWAFGTLEPYDGWNGCHELFGYEKCVACGTALYTTKER